MTHWSLVARAGRDTGEAKRRALAALLEQYLAALRSHLVFRRRVPSQEADDLLQGFLVSKVLERDLVSGADRERGKFRTFLLTSLDRYVMNQVRDRQAAKRSGPTVPLDAAVEVGDAAGPPAYGFEVEWARQVLRQAVDAMERECAAQGRPEVWGVFEARTLHPTLHQREPVPYGELVQRFGFKSPAQASNILVTANRMFARNLRAVIAQYEADEERIEQEIEDLKSILSRARPEATGGDTGDDDSQ